MITLLRLFACLTLLLVTAAGCTRDPHVLKYRDLERGDAHLAANRHPEAFIEYSKAIQRDPNFSEGYERLGRLHLEEGNQLKAWQSYQRAANLAPDDFELQVEAGGMLLLARRFDDARRLADGVLARDPKHVPALVLRANALVGLEDLDSAIRLIQDAIQMAPTASDLYSNLGSLLATTGDFAEAERTYRQAVQVAPAVADAYLPMGNFYWAVGRIQQAEQAFLKALEVEPQHLLAHRAIATFYLGSGQAMKAEAAMRFVAEKTGEIDHKIALGDYYLVTGRVQQGEALLRETSQQPGGGDKARTRLAAAAYAQGRREAAQTAVDEVLTTSPNFAPAVLLKARFARDGGKKEEALTLAVRATTLQADYIEALYLVGEMHSELGDQFQAIEAYKKIVEVNPFARSAQIQLARAMYARGEVGASGEYLSSVMRRASTDLDTRVALTKALVERRDFREAEGHLKAMLQQYPRSGDVLALMGTLSALRRDLPAARTWYDRALQQQPGRLDAVSGLVGLDLEARRFADARRRAESYAAAAAPGRAEPLLLLAKTYGAVKDLDLAEQTLRRAIDVDANSYDAYGMLGQLLYQSGRLAEGRVEFERLAEARPRSVAAHTMVAIILRQEGKTDAAVGRYKEALKIDPEAPVAANNLAWIYAEQGTNLEEAVILAKAARKMLPDSVDVGDTLGWVYHRNGHPNLVNLAIPLLEETVRKAPTTALFRYHLGAVYARAGRVVDARRELNEALRLSPDFNGSAETRRLLTSLN